MDLMRGEIEKDELKGLPDEILLHILSFLRLKDAAKTSQIRRFGTMWRRIAILDFDQCSYHRCHNGPYRDENFIDLIRQVTKPNSNLALEKLRLRFHFPQGRYAAEITSLVRYALSRKVKILDLDLLGCGLFELLEDYTLPDCVFRSDFLTELRLAYCDIRIDGEFMINLKSLRILFLNGVDLNDELMEKIVVGCPLLEDLTIIGCSSLRNLNCNFNSNLRKLDLVLHMGEPLTISCSKMVTLMISGCVERARLV